MRNTVHFGNGINRISDNAVSWTDLLDRIIDSNAFENGDIPNTMVSVLLLLLNHRSIGQHPPPTISELA
jgi:hypothetical protein